MTTSISAVGFVASAADPHSIGTAPTGAGTQSNEPRRLDLLPDQPAGESIKLSSRHVVALATQENRAQAAQQLRQIHSTLNSVGNALSGLRDVVTAIVKQYPPYPANSPDRVRLTNEMVSLHKLIVSLTYQPPQASQPAGASGAGTGFSIGTGGQLQGDLKQILWSTPDTAGLSDAQLAALLPKVDAAKSQVDSLSQGMWTDVVQSGPPVEPQVIDLARQSQAGLAGGGAPISTAPTVLASLARG